MEDKLKELLSARQKQCIADPDRRPAAVLVPIYLKDGKYHILFIRRTETVKVHKGQISFPGGNREKSDRTLLDTALREGEEEIGLKPGDAALLGELDDEITLTSDYIVSPFVVAIPCPYRFTPNRREVADIIEIPLEALLDDSCRRRGEMPEEPRDAYTYHYGEHVIWGATARSLTKFLAILAKVTGREAAAT